MKCITRVVEAQEWSRSFFRKQAQEEKNRATPIALVPTMGGLHKGHAALIHHARRLAGPAGKVIVSLFVNPTQFAPHEDLSRYPRSLAADISLCEQAGADVLFHPSVEEIYAADRSVMIEEDMLSLGLCGVSRPHHFSGVMTIVAKLFNITAPQIAIFGEKDWQQLALVRRLVRDLNFPIEIIGHPIVRESDGLAMSSRNAYLTKEERTAAPAIYQALQATASLAQAGEKNISKLLATTTTMLRVIPHAIIDYSEIVDGLSLRPLTTILPSSTAARLLVAVKLGTTRLIDNIALLHRAS